MKNYLLFPTYQAALQLTEIGPKAPRRAAPGNITSIFPFADIILVNYALHYSNIPWVHFEDVMVELWSQLNEFGTRRGKMALYREVVSQHFPGTGHYDASVYAQRYGKDAELRARCVCEEKLLHVNTAVPDAAWWPCGGGPDGKPYKTPTRCHTPRGMNIFFHNLTRRFPHVRMVPLEQITLPRHKSHLGPDDYGRNCDCTHYCWSASRTYRHRHRVKV